MASTMRIEFKTTSAGSIIKSAWRDTPHHISLFSDETLKVFYLKTTETVSSTQENLRYLLGALDSPTVTEISTDDYQQAKEGGEKNVISIIKELKS